MHRSYRPLLGRAQYDRARQPRHVHHRSNCSRVIWMDEGHIRYDGPSEQAADLYLSTIPTTADFRQGEELIERAVAHERGELLVRGSSGQPQLYLIRAGHRHPISSQEWCEINAYIGSDVVVVTDEVIMQVPEGDVL